MSAIVTGDYTLGPSAGASPLLTDLVAFYKLEEASGTRADEVGSADLTDNNTVTQAAGKFGNAGQFTSANTEWLSSTDVALTTGGGSFSVMAWIYLDSTGVFQDAVSKGTFGDNGSNFNEYRLFINDLNKAAFHLFNGGDQYPVGNNDTAVTADAWHLLIGTYDAATGVLQIWLDAIDGYTVTSIPIPNTNSNPFQVGRGVNFSAGYFNGRIDSVGFWTRALTGTDVGLLWNGGAGRDYPF